MTDSLGMRISKMLFEAEPELLACNPEAAARAAVAVAEALGCVMAIIWAKEGRATYEEAMKIATARAEVAARGTLARTAELIGKVNTTPH